MSKTKRKEPRIVIEGVLAKPVRETLGAFSVSLKELPILEGLFSTKPSKRKLVLFLEHDVEENVWNITLQLISEDMNYWDFLEKEGVFSSGSIAVPCRAKTSTTITVAISTLGVEVKCTHFTQSYTWVEIVKGEEWDRE